MERLKWKKILIVLFIFTTVSVAVLFYCTVTSLKSIPRSFHDILSDSYHVQILDRHGEPLNITYQNKWNIHDTVELYEVPEFLKKAFIISEDQRFYKHSGIDWLARISALFMNIKEMRVVRGASTITEQVVRIINSRPRTFWSRWIEGFEAADIEKYFVKDEILEFYINQVPYTANRRGVVQAARYYFNRDLDTLNKKEMLALVILVRAPSRLDLWKNSKKIEVSVSRLADKLFAKGLLSKEDKNRILTQKFELEQPRLPINANEFVRHVKQSPFIGFAGWPRVRTTLDRTLQKNVQEMLDNRLNYLKSKKVSNGAVLAVDHTNGEILVWAVAGKNKEDIPGRFIDAVQTPRQPGSALKPFLYSLALSKGWSAATIIDDVPLTESVGNGLHSYQNYSHTFYGPVTLRQALGNSLNIPALKTLQYVGVENYLQYLNKIGFTGLNKHPDFYGYGIALGSGEVTLYQLVQAYATIANNGVFHPLSSFIEDFRYGLSYQVIAPEIASLIANILSDSKARDLEFGEHSVLNFPVQTAVKTGTSSDYRDSWAVGFNYRYTVGIWMGNMDQRPTNGVTGSIGPVLLLRSIFAELNKYRETKPLPIHKKLIKHDLCIDTKIIRVDSQKCKTYTEWFVAGTAPKTTVAVSKIDIPILLRRPSNNLQMAYDPRIPGDLQVFEFYIQGISENENVRWHINDEKVVTKGGRYLWPLKRGKHELEATIWQENKQIYKIEKIKFLVK